MIEGVATSAATIAINNANQTLEIGPAGNLTINGNEFITNGTIKLDGGTLADKTGSTEDTFTVGSGGTLTGFGTAPNDITLAGGTISQSGGVLTAISITGVGTVNGVTGAFEIAASGGTLDLTGTVNNALLVADPNKGGSVLKIDGNVTAGDTGWIDIHSANQTVEIGAGGILTLPFVETMTNGTIQLDGGTLNATDGMVVGGGATVIGQGVVTATYPAPAAWSKVPVDTQHQQCQLQHHPSGGGQRRLVGLALDGTVATGISLNPRHRRGPQRRLAARDATAQTSSRLAAPSSACMSAPARSLPPTHRPCRRRAGRLTTVSSLEHCGTVQRRDARTPLHDSRFAPNAGTFID